MAHRIIVQLKRSYIAKPAKIKKILKGLGLTKRESITEFPDTPSIRGMIQKVSHMVSVKVIEKQ